MRWKVYEKRSSGDGDFRIWEVEETGSSREEREFSRWEVRRWTVHEMRSLRNGKFRRWEVEEMGVHEMESRGDGSFRIWGV